MAAVGRWEAGRLLCESFDLVGSGILGLRRGMLRCPGGRVFPGCSRCQRSVSHGCVLGLPWIVVLRLAARHHAVWPVVAMVVGRIEELAYLLHGLEQGLLRGPVGEAHQDVSRVVPQLRERLLKVGKGRQLAAHDVEHGRFVVQLATALRAGGDAAGGDVDVFPGTGLTALKLAQHLPERQVRGELADQPPAGYLPGLRLGDLQRDLDGRQGV